MKDAIDIVLENMELIAKRASEALDGEYTSVTIEVVFSHGKVTREFGGYTSPGGHVKRSSLDGVAGAILPNKAKLELEAARLREEANKIEALIAKGGAQ